MLFTAPIYLLLLLPAIAGLVASFRYVHGMAPMRKRLAFLLRFALAACLIIALAGPEARRRNHGTAVVFLVDRSDSISDTDRAREEAFVRTAVSKLPSEDQAAVVVFGGDARLESGMDGARSLPKLSSVVRSSATDLAGAIRLGSALFPDGKGRRLVLLTDANETEGDVAGAADVISTEHIPIDVVALGGDSSSPEVAVDAVQVPSEASADRPFELRIIVDSTVEQIARIVIDRDGKPFKTVNALVHRGKTAVVVQDSLKDAGFHRYRAALEAKQDTDPRNNVGLGFVSVRGRPKVLVMQENSAEPTLANALRRAGVTVDVRGPGQIPNRPDEVQDYDAVFLNDFNASHLVPQQLEMLRTAAEASGIGLAMVGGENSFLPGGYYGTPVAEALPVDLNVRQRKDLPAASIAIIGDVSGSMGMPEDGIPKVRLMAKAAEETVKMIDGRHRVGVAGSAQGIEWVAPMQSAENKADVIRQIERLDIGGAGIFAHMTIVEAKQVLEKEHNPIRHFIMLADGDDVKAQEECLPLIVEMRAEHITTSVVAIGDGKDVGFLQQVASLGGGRYYLADHANKLPSIITQDSSIVARSAIEEGAFIPKLVEGEEITSGIDSPPPLLAYDLTDSRPLARTGMRTRKDDPLLATWQYGLATTLAFTSDAQPRWAKFWAPWSGFSTFWGQAAQAITRRAAQNNYDVVVAPIQGKALVTVHAMDALGDPLAASTLNVHIGGPDGSSSSLALTATAPGEYVGQFDADKLGSYLVSVVEPGPNGKSRVQTAGFSQPYPVELRTFRTNEALLERVRQTTGGRKLTEPMAALAPLANPGESISELWFVFLAVGLALLPLDIALRRLALPIPELLAALGMAVRSLPLRARRSRAPKPAPVHVERLHQAKRRGSHTSAPSPVPVPSGDRPPTPTPQPARVEPEREVEPVGAAKSVGDRLLDAKRKRRE